LYCLCFYLFTSEKAETSRGIVLTALFVGGLQLYIQTEADAAAAQLRVGLLSSSMSVLYCAAPLATVVQVTRTKSTESLPLNLILATVAMTCSWSLYGIIIQDRFVLVPNILGCIIASGQLSLFAIYHSSSSQKYIV